MGNTLSNNSNNGNYIKYNNDNYNHTDAKVISKVNVANINIKTKNDSKCSKMYIIYQRVNGISKAFVLDIKILDLNIFVYVTDILNEKTTLVHVSRISINSQKFISYYLKYIQVSRDFMLVSLPENEKINVYNLTKLLNRNVLEFVSTVGLIIKADKNDEITSTIDFSNKTNESSNQQNKIDNIIPYKCILCKNVYIIICIGDAIYEKIIVTDYKNKSIHSLNMIDLDLNIHKSTLTFSINGRYVIIYDKMKKQVLMSDMNETNPKLEHIIIKNNIIAETLCISDNGKFIFFVEDTCMEFRIFDIHSNKIFMLNSEYNLTNIDNDRYNLLDNVKFHLLDYSQFAEVDLKNTNDHIYVIIAWNKRLSLVLYWIMRCSTSDHKGCLTSYYKLRDRSIIDMKLQGKLEYTYSNGNIFINKTTDELTVTDLNKAIPSNIVSLLANESRYDLIKLFKKTYNQNNYYDKIDIIGADESRIIYQVTDFMQFLMLLNKSTNSSNIFKLRVTANINIYGTIKSFNVYQDVLTGKITHDDIISEIFKIKGSACRHNVTNDLMNHIYEYTRIIVLKETTNGDLVRNDISSECVMYIGYTFALLVLKYYSTMTKLLTNNDSNTKHINLDIVKTFNKNFPAFEDFVKKSIELIIGEKLN